MGDDSIQAESSDNDQALAICSSIWEERNMNPNEKLLKAIRDRQKQTEFGYGILTADRWVQNMVDACGLPYFQERACTKNMSFNDCLQKAKSTLVYSNPDMRVEEKQANGEELELPKNTLMVFRHVLTTPRKDRDGDVLRTQGAVVDPDMLLLWQHVHTLPIGKMLQIAEQDSNKLSLVSAIVDMNELSHDAAVMVDNGMARFSHGFRALQFDELKEEEGEVTSPGGFDIKEFEIMEESIVSVPSNTDAQVEEQMLDLIEGRRLTSDLMKEYGKTLRERHPVTVPVTVEITTKVNGKEVRDEDESRSRSAETERQGQADDDPGSAPEEAKDAGQEGSETQVPEDAKMMNGPLEGSWEWIEMELRRVSADFMKNNIVGMSDRDWAYLVATFVDHAVVCVEKPEAGVPDEFRYFKAEWELKENKPEFKGTPTQVEIVTTTELIERFPGLVSRKSHAKAGRRLSRSVIATLKEVRDDLAELDEMENMSRGGGALCKRCMDKLNDLISEPEDDENATEVSVKDAIAIVLARSSFRERTNLLKLLKGFQRIEQQTEKRKTVRALVGH